MKICTLTTIKASLQETIAFVDYHTSCGVDHMFLYFDDPSDTALSCLSNHDRVTALPCNSDHWTALGILNPEKLSLPEKQIANSKDCLIRARTDGFDWIGHIDHDEFIFSPNGIKQDLASHSKSTETINFPVWEAIPETEELFEIKGFKYSYLPRFNKELFRYSASDLSKIFKSKVFYTLRKTFCNQFTSCNAFAHRLNKGHIEGKSFTRTQAAVKFLDVHRPQPKDGKRLSISISKSTKILHYDAPSFKSWKEKWGNSSRRRDHYVLSRHRLSIYHAFTELYTKHRHNQLKELYRMLYFLSDRDFRILKILGCAFNPPKTTLPSKIHNSSKK